MRKTLLLGLVLLAGPALATIFFGGQFSAEDVDMATLSLMAYSFGLIGFTLVKVLVPGYFSRQDTTTPVRIGVIALLVNMLLNILIVIPWYRSGVAGPHAGLAIATSLSAMLNAGLLYRGLRREGVLQHEAGWGRFILQVVVASAVMAMLLRYFVPPVEDWLAASLLENCLWLFAAIGGGVVAYVMCLLVTGVRPAQLRLRPRS